MKLLMIALLSTTACFSSSTVPAGQHTEPVSGNAAAGKGSTMAHAAEVKRRASTVAEGQGLHYVAKTTGGTYIPINGKVAVKSMMLFLEQARVKVDISFSKEIVRAAALLQEHCPREYLTILQDGDRGLCLHPVEPLSPPSEETQIELAYQFARCVLRNEGGFDAAMLDVLVKIPGPRTEDASLRLADYMQDDDQYRTQIAGLWRLSHPMKVLDFKELANHIRTRSPYREGFVHPKIKSALNPDQAKNVLQWVNEGGKIRTFIEAKKVVKSESAPLPLPQSNGSGK